MAFVAVPAGVTPRFRRDSLRRVTASRVVAARPGTGSVRRASIRAAAPQQVSAEELEEILKESNVPLSQLKKGLVPQLEEMAEKMQDRVRIVKIDTDDYAEYSTAIGVRGLPSLYFIQDGKLKHKMEGANTADKLVAMAEHYFFDGPKPQLS